MLRSGWTSPAVTTGTMGRRLAAMLAAGMAGYLQLTEADETCVFLSVTAIH